MRLLWLVLALLTFGCSPSRTIYLGDDEPDSVTFATLDAVDLWNDALGFEALSVRVVGRAELGHVQPGAIVVVSRAEVGGPDTYTAADTVIRGPFMRVRLERSAFQVAPGYLESADQGADLVAHELGHALGLGHHGDALKGTGGANLMRANGYGREGRELTTGQRRRVRALLAGTLLLAP